MVAPNSLRPFQRMKNGVLIYLRLEDWPADVPLPENTTLVKTGAGPFQPYWDLILETDRTIEVVVGWFNLPLPLDEAIEWYRMEMSQRGWMQVADQGHRLPESASLCFQLRETNVQSVVDLRQRPEGKGTQTMIRRVVEHPWSPVAEQPPEPAAEIA